jgi:hypothetical protein
MHKNISRFLACAALFAACTVPASAKDYILTGTARVDRVTVIDHGVFSYDPAGLISYADPISFSLRFTTDLAQVSPTFDADPTVNIYDLGRPLSFSLTMGGYTFTTPAGRRPLDLSAQLWNDRQVVPGQPTTDAQSFRIFDYTVGGRKAVLPFTMPAGAISEGVDLMNFGPSTLRSSDLISELPSLDGFTHMFSYIVQNSSADYAVIVDGRNVEMALAPVPEPATWAMLICGFGLAGAAARQRRIRIYA